LQFRNAHVVDDLRVVNRRELLDRFDFEQDRVRNDEVDVLVAQQLTTIGHRVLLLTFERNPGGGELDCYRERVDTFP